MGMSHATHTLSFPHEQIVRVRAVYKKFFFLAFFMMIPTIFCVYSSFSRSVIKTVGKKLFLNPDEFISRVESYNIHLVTLTFYE